MAFNWRYFQETGQAGGTTSLQYVDSFNGDDANSGAYNAPKQSIQGAYDASGNNATFVLAGFFNEGDFLNTGTNLRIVSDGFVTLDGTGFLEAIKTTSTCNINQDGDFGTLLYKNYDLPINFRYASNPPTTYISNVIFDNIGLNHPGLQGSGFTQHIFVDRCLFINSLFTCNRPAYIENNTFINSSEMRIGNTVDLTRQRNNFFDETSILDYASLTPNVLNYNFYQGTMTNKIRVGGVWYDNVEALQAATAYEADSLPSTTDPLINSDGYSISETSPLRNTGWDKRGIGYTQMSHNTDATSVGVWTLSDLVLDTDKFILDVGATVGTATSTLVEVFSRVRTILSINLPDFVINPFTGETIGRLATDRTPYTVSVEIQYSINGTTTNGTWLRVPIGTKPMHDTVNDVGNDDPLFDVANAVAIEASHLQYRVTLRNNETPLV
jgi:hypothetical protein